FEIDDALSGAPDTVPVATASGLTIRSAFLLASLVGLVVGSGLTWAITNARRTLPPIPSVRRFAITLGSADVFGSLTAAGHVVALSPDGSRLVYVANGRLYLQVLDQIDAVPVAGTEGGPVEPIFSPDGRWIAF